MTKTWSDFEEEIKGSMREKYSATASEHAVNPRNAGEIKDAAGFGRIAGPCGDTMSIWLKIDKETILEAGFATDGCGTSLASGSMVTELAKGRNVIEAQQINQHDVLEALDGLPEGSEHCALLDANTLKATIRNYFARKAKS